ncbi:uncharacterized protein EDB93DRAFT_1104727 [Suillus bovinus]|uniref:uncharacterized protein n=1 Tax=Suillus bovinus TaxID=48563 RepID=UPI001B8667E1|nr:uncharacterized protein EDB93DRAFT_1104727 [Suillus bovinus]KAG2145488.1 hypothetical protein EDB93DRAFT_1104727 [Suillus bovinus]
MGLKIKKKAADDAVKEEEKAVKMLKPHKPLRKLKLEDLPLQDKGPRPQELWDIFFQHNALDINKHPTIKKIATNHLNEWCSTFGKDALKILKCQFRHPKFCHDIDAWIKFVHDHLPCKVNNQKCVPFVFADIKNFKGAWLSPILLELAATYIKHCGKAFSTFGKQIGALGLAAAVYHHALSLYTEGELAKEAAKCNLDMAGGKNLKNIDFDAAWGSIAMCYVEQATGLPGGKWEAIKNALTELVEMDARSDDEGFDNDDNNIMDICGVVLLSDAEDGGPQLEQMDS